VAFLSSILKKNKPCFSFKNTNKKPQLNKYKLVEAVFVESERIELSSKQAIQELSTRLVFTWFSLGSRSKTTCCTLSFLSFRIAPKHHDSYSDIFGFSTRNAAGQGFPEKSRLPAWPGHGSILL